VAVLITLGSLDASALEFTETQKEAALNRGRYDRLGQQVDMWGEFAAAAAPGKDDKAGAVYVYKRSTSGEWSRIQILTASDKRDNAQFGISMRMGLNRIVVGSDHLHEHTAAAYVFERATASDTFSQVQRLTPDTIRERDYFGCAVAIDGDRIVVGAHGEEHYTPGAAFLFERSNSGTWRQTHRFVCPENSDSDEFGSSVALDDYGMYVGAPMHDGRRGAAYAFTKSGGMWDEPTLLEPAAGAAGQYFGVSVAPFANGVLVGAIGVNRFNGAVYIFSRGGDQRWTQTDSLYPTRSGQTSYAYFGNALDVWNTNLAVAAPGDFDSRGAGYLYTLDNGTWNIRQRIISSQNRPEASFGRSIGITPTHLIAGAPADQHDPSGGSSTYQAGVVYFFENADTAAVYPHHRRDMRTDAVTTLRGGITMLSHDQLQLRLPHDGREVTLSSPSGRVVLRKRFEPGATSTVFVEMKRCARGLYLLMVADAFGATTTRNVVVP